MPSSESEDFESADEGNGSVEKKERKKRSSSSNYGDGALEDDQNLSKVPTKLQSDKKAVPKENTDGWDDFDLDEDAIDITELPASKPEAKEAGTLQNKVTDQKETEPSTQNTGWDDFYDWGDSEVSNNTQKELPKSHQKKHPDADIREVTERMAAASTASAGLSWGWGWSVDSLLSTATAGISNITTQVSQGISTVLETGIGAPDPEELARRAKESQAKETPGKPTTPIENVQKSTEEESRGSGGDAFPAFGSLLSGVTKFVETTGTKVLAGGLDTLETIGKKTMEVLQDGDPGLAKKRAMLGLDSGDKPILSQVLREAKAKADEEDRVKDERREAKEVHYESLFDDFEGLVHLEALEMLSRQVSMRIEECIRIADPEKRQDIKETMQQVAELCEMPEEEDDEDEPSSDDKAEAFHERLHIATQDLGLKLQFQPIVKQYTEILHWLSTDQTEKATYKKCVSALAQATALSVQTYHKAGELLLTKPRRSTADEADALTQMTVVLTKHISELATLFTEKLNSLPTDNKEQINNYITNIFLEAGNSSTYIQNAFQLALPILQIGAV